MTESTPMADEPHLHALPFDLAFYSALRADRIGWKVRKTDVLGDLTGMACTVDAGEAIQLRLEHGAQAVHVFPFNRDDPDERYYAQQMGPLEGFYLGRYSRLFGTLPRLRPLMTLLEDTVVQGPGPGGHHLAFGGSGTPHDWQSAGGRRGVATIWDQYATLLTAASLPVSLIKDEACLFEKAAFDPYTQRVVRVPSDAIRGDCVTLFAEVDLTVLVALSPYIDGRRAPQDLTDKDVRPVRVTILSTGATPLPWTYPGEPYGDPSRYLTEAHLDGNTHGRSRRGL